MKESRIWCGSVRFTLLGLWDFFLAPIHQLEASAHRKMGGGCVTAIVRTGHAEGGKR